MDEIQWMLNIVNASGGKMIIFHEAECFSAMRGDDFPSINHDSRAPTPSSVAWMNANLKITLRETEDGIIWLYYIICE